LLAGEQFDLLQSDLNSATKENNNGKRKQARPQIRAPPPLVKVDFKIIGCYYHNCFSFGLVQWIASELCTKPGRYNGYATYFATDVLPLIELNCISG